MLGFCAFNTLTGYFYELISNFVLFVQYAVLSRPYNSKAILATTFYRFMLGFCAFNTLTGYFYELISNFVLFVQYAVLSRPYNSKAILILNSCLCFSPVDSASITK